MRRTFLWTSVGAVSPFDAMVVIEVVAEELAGKDTVLWAVGLQDDEFVSGPLLFGRGRRPMALAATDVPTGAVLVVFDAAAR